MPYIYAGLIDGLICAVPATDSTVGFTKAAGIAFPSADSAIEGWSASYAIHCKWRGMAQLHTRLATERGMAQLRTRLATEQMYRDKATAYVWGWQDAGGSKFDGLADPWAFSVAYGLLAAQFLDEQRTHMPPIQDAFQSWCTDSTIGGPLTSTVRMIPTVPQAA